MTSAVAWGITDTRCRTGFIIMKKSFRKRIRMTKQGKIVRRPMRLDHFKTRKTTKNVRGKRKTLSLDHPLKKLEKVAK